MPSDSSSMNRILAHPPVLQPGCNGEIVASRGSQRHPPQQASGIALVAPILHVIPAQLALAVPRLNSVSPGLCCCSHVAASTVPSFSQPTPAASPPAWGLGQRASNSPKLVPPSRETSISDHSSGSNPWTISCCPGPITIGGCVTRVWVLLSVRDMVLLVWVTFTSPAGRRTKLEKYVDHGQGTSEVGPPYQQ